MEKFNVAFVGTSGHQMLKNHKPVVDVSLISGKIISGLNEGECDMEKLKNIQSKLKVPKGRKNGFGNYKYRSTEDILKALTPLLAEENCTLVVSDSVELIGDRYYIKATATLKDVCTSKTEASTGYAREALVKKGMDESQITGACSSYARKYALNGLFAIDDTEDADATEGVETPPAKTTKAPAKTTAPPKVTPPPAEIDREQAKANAKETEAKVSEELNKDNVAPPPEPATATQIAEIKRLATKKGSAVSAINKNYKITNLSDICWIDAKHCLDELKKRKDVVK